MREHLRPYVRRMSVSVVLAVTGQRGRSGVMRFDCSCVLVLRVWHRMGVRAPAVQ